MKILLIAIASLTGLIVIIEGGLRLVWGLGNPPLYIADENVGYLLAPNQELRRMGNRIKINQYSMRSQEITANKIDSTFRVLLLGDSIINGGWWTDQAETIPALVEAEIELGDRRTVEVLNASANSWGPRNELAYLQHFGLFDTDAVILVINTDDLFATAPTSLAVGKVSNYPDKAPPLALVELYQHYFSKPQSIPELEKIKREESDRVGLNLAAIKKIHQLTLDADATFVLAMTPLGRELKGAGSRDYELKARKRLQEFTEVEQISYIDFLPIFADFPQPEFLYRDRIHLSPHGNEMVSETLSQAIQAKIKK